VDTRNGVFNEAGDCVVAKGWLQPEKATELSELVCGRAPGRSSDDQITLFKSVGTAVQDIALAVRVHHNAMKLGLGRELFDFPIVADRSPPKLRQGKSWAPAIDEAGLQLEQHRAFGDEDG
jgi:hypothetical protein